MQLPLPLQPPAAAATGGQGPSVLFVRHRRARRYILRVLDDGAVRVTLPRWGTRRDAIAFLQQQDDWVQAQRQRRREARAAARLTPGVSAVLVDGVSVPLVTRPAPGGRVAVWCGADRVPVDTPLDVLDLGPVVVRWLRQKAARQLPVELHAEAAVHGITVTRVTVRDQQSRWGSCSRRGTIALNWRLVQVPPWVRRYVLVHELMHRRELNHSARFWDLVRAACPDADRARHWLRTDGPALFQTSSVDGC